MSNNRNTGNYQKNVKDFLKKMSDLSGTNFVSEGLVAGDENEDLVILTPERAMKMDATGALHDHLMRTGEKMTMDYEFIFLGTRVYLVRCLRFGVVRFDLVATFINPSEPKGLGSAIPEEKPYWEEDTQPAQVIDMAAYRTTKLIN